MTEFNGINRRYERLSHTQTTFNAFAFLSQFYWDVITVIINNDCDAYYFHMKSINFGMN